MRGRTRGTVSTTGQPLSLALRWGSWPLQGVAWVHARAADDASEGGPGDDRSRHACCARRRPACSLSLWMVTFGLMWGMVAVLLGALIEQVAEMLPPGDGLEMEPRIAVWLWMGFLVAYPVRWLVLRLLALRRPAARAAMGQMLSGPLRVWHGRWCAAGADRTIDGAAASGRDRGPGRPVTTRRDRARTTRDVSGWRRRRSRVERHEAPQRPVTPPPLPVPRTRSAGWAFGPPVELPEGPLLTIEPFVGYRRWVVRPSSVVGGSSAEPVLGQRHRRLPLAGARSRCPVLARQAEPFRPTDPDHAHRPIARLPMWDLCVAGPRWSGLASRCSAVRRGCGRTVRDRPRGGAWLSSAASQGRRPARVANRVRARSEAPGRTRACARRHRRSVSSGRIGTRWHVRSTPQRCWRGVANRSSLPPCWRWWRRSSRRGIGRTDRRRRQLGMDIGPIKRVWEVEPVETPAEPARVEPEPAGAGSGRADGAARAGRAGGAGGAGRARPRAGAGANGCPDRPTERAGSGWARGPPRLRPVDPALTVDIISPRRPYRDHPVSVGDYPTNWEGGADPGGVPQRETRHPGACPHLVGFAEPTARWSP